MKRTMCAALLAVIAACLLGDAHAQDKKKPTDKESSSPTRPVKLFEKGDRVVFIGDTFAEREALFGYIETAIQTRFPELGLTFRNLGYSADTPATLLADLKGTMEYNHGSNRALNFGTMEKHLTDVKADVIVLCFGMAASFAGKEGVADFERDLRALIKTYGAKKFNGKSPPRFILVGPIAHEKLGGEFPDPSEHNEQLKLYSAAMAKVAKENAIPFADLFTPSALLMAEKGGDKFTINGIHLTEYGYWATAQALAHQLSLPSINPKLTVGAKDRDSSVTIKNLPTPPPTDAQIHPSLLRQQPHVKKPGVAEGKYQLRFDERAYLIVSSRELAAGVPVLESPFHDRAHELRLAVVARNSAFFQKWRAVNGEYIYGRRAKPFGVVNFPAEMAQLDEICQNLDRSVLEANTPVTVKSILLGPTTAVDVIEFTGKMKRKKLPSVRQLYNQKQGLIGGKIVPTALDPSEALKHFKLQDGYEINLFASEKDFPLHNPLAMAWDAKGRLWVTTMPSYPQLLPGQRPHDGILILEDTKGAGKADKCTVFANDLYLPTGLEFGNGGVYAGAQPNMLFIKNDNDKAGKREVILHGLGTGDSHHAVHAFTWGPDGAMYFNEGVFHRTNTETPHGVVRNRDAGIYRFQPKSHKLEAYVRYHFANPWGQVWDRWGQNFIADASGGNNYFALPMTGRIEYPEQHPTMKVFTSIVRPTCGCEIVSSRHFPPEAQGNFLVNNCIGFQGIKQHKIIEEGSGFTSKELEPLLFSTDPNFRPVDIKFGPDGALYIVDWYNPLIGHMQFSIRDPGRDHYHGRIWRITAKNRPLVKAPKIAGEPVEKLLDLLKEPEDRTRYRVRAELRDRKRDEVIPALKTWMMKQDETKESYEHHLLEALWVQQNHNAVDTALLNRMLLAKDYRARAAATRMLRYADADTFKLLADQANDVHPRVRLEAVIACSFHKTERAADIALQALKHPMDYYLEYGLKETIAALEPYWKPALAAGKPFAVNNPAGAAYVLNSVSTAELIKMARTGPIYQALLMRDGILPQYRKEALEGLAKLNKTDPLRELFTAIEQLDHGSAHADHVLLDLGSILTAHKADELIKVKPQLEKLAQKSQRPLTRQVAYVALMTADAAIDKTWAAAEKNLHTLRDVVEAIPLLPDAKLRESAYPKVKPLLHGLPDHLAAQAKKTKGTFGRYVRIELPGPRRVLTLAEVQVYSGGVNIAPQGKAKQSSTDFDGVAKRAIDGNISGNFADGGQTHSKENEKNPWWELDLGSEQPIEAIVIWNRTDGNFGKRLDGFNLSILDEHRKGIYFRGKNLAPDRNVRFEMQSDLPAAIRLAAIGAITSIPGHEAETFTTLSTFVQKGVERDASVRALRRIPRSKWPAKEVTPLLDSLVNWVSKLPAEDRTEPAALDALQLGNDLASVLPPAQAKAIRAKLGELGVNVVLIRTVPHKMAYDRTKFYVEAGKPVVVVLENSDIQPHNLIITTPGAMTEIGMAADLMSTNPSAFASDFIPKSPKVLHATRMLAPREVQRLTFTAPTKPGEYPYVCTFPGHWRVMYGTMHVVPRLSDVPPHELNPPTEIVEARPFVKNWTYDELVSELAEIERGRSFKTGQEMFKAASCIQCHKVGNGKDGGIIGPDLNETARKLLDKKLTRADLLRELIEPSKVITDKFKTQILITTGGEVITGIVTQQDKQKLTIVINPQTKPREIALSDIEERRESNVSLMPNGLLSTLTREEILDLLAYIAAGGDASHPAFSRRD